MARFPITFDKSAQLDILKAFGKEVDDEGFIVESADRSQKVLTSNGEEITLGEWGGITKGSETFVKNDAVSLIEVAKRL